MPAPLRWSVTSTSVTGSRHVWPAVCTRLRSLKLGFAGDVAIDEVDAAVVVHGHLMTETRPSKRCALRFARLADPMLDGCSQVTGKGARWGPQSARLAVAVFDAERRFALGRSLRGGVGRPGSLRPRGFERFGAPTASSSWRSLQNVSRAFVDVVLPVGSSCHVRHARLRATAIGAILLVAPGADALAERAQPTGEAHRGVRGFAEHLARGRGPLL
jgi:hypothetical protein